MWAEEKPQLLSLDKKTGVSKKNKSLCPRTNVCGCQMNVPLPSCYSMAFCHLKDTSESGFGGRGQGFEIVSAAVYKVLLQTGLQCLSDWLCSVFGLAGNAELVQTVKRGQDSEYNARYFTCLIITTVGQATTHLK